MPSDDSSWILSLIVMEQYNGEPGALRGACPVLREDCANLPPKGGKAALSYSTPFTMLPSTRATGEAIFSSLADCLNNNHINAKKEDVMNLRLEKLRQERDKLAEKLTSLTGTAQSPGRADSEAGKHGY